MFSPRNQCLGITYYNVRQCFSTDGHYRPELIASVLNEIKPDIAVLTHIDPVLWADEQVSQAAYFQQMMHFQGVIGEAFGTPQGMLRTVMLSCFEVDNSAKLRPDPLSSPECATLDVVLNLGISKLRLVTFHLADSRALGELQIDNLINRLADNQGPAILLIGDIPDPRRHIHALRRLDSYFETSTVLASYPAIMPIFAPQRLWTRAPTSISNCRVHSTAASRAASSCLPICGTLTVHANGVEDLSQAAIENLPAIYS